MTWDEQVVTALADVREDLAREVRAETNAFMSRTKPLVVLTGVYSCGKTTLIKRLLVDEGRAVPKSLVVGGGPTSYEQADYDLPHWTVLDTPGLESGRGHHDTSLPRFFDVLQVCVDGGLMSSESELLERITGHDVAPRGWPYPPGGVRIVLIGFDRLAPVPGQAMDRIVEAKLEESRTLVQSIGVDPSGVAFDAVSPDPGGRTANREVTGGSYAPSREWDRVASYIADLTRTVEDRQPLRRAGLVRGLLRAVKEAVTEVEAATGEARAQISRLDAVLSAAGSNIESIRDFGRRAENDLRASLDSAVADVATPARVESLMVIALRDWQDKWGESLERLAAEIGAEDFDVWRVRLDGLEASGTSGDHLFDEGDEIRVEENVESAQRKMEDHIRRESERLFGTDITDLQGEVRRWRRAKSKRDFYKSSKLFKKRDDVETAQKLVRRQQQIAIGSAFAGLAWTLWKEERDEKRRREREEQRIEDLRTQARAAAARHAHDIFHGYADVDTGTSRQGWKALVEELAAEVKSEADEARESLNMATDEGDRLKGLRDRLVALRRQAPRP